MRIVFSTLVLLGLATPVWAFDTPEPGSVALVAVGIAAALYFGRKKP